MVNTPSPQTSFGRDVLANLRDGAVFCAVAFWKWPVLSTVALTFYGLGITAMYGGNYMLAVSFCLLGLVLLAARAIAQSRTEGGKAGAVFVIAVFSFVATFASLFWIKHTYETQTHSANTFSVAAAWSWQNIETLWQQVRWRWILPGTLLGAFLWSLVSVVRNRRRTTQGLGTEQPEGVGHPYRWLHEVAMNDKAIIDRLVRIPWVIYRPYFDGKEPFVDFVVGVFNNSLYDIVIDNSIKGDIWCDSSDNPFHYEPKIYPAHPIACRSRSGTNFIIRHPLTAGEVSRFDGSDNVLIGFGSLEITFAGTEQFSEIGSTQLGTNHYLKTKEGAWPNPNGKDEFAFLYTDEQWALLAAANQPSGQAGVEKTLIESRSEIYRLQQELTKLSEGIGGKKQQYKTLSQNYDVLENEKESLASKLEALQRHNLLLDVDVTLSMDGWEPRQSSLVLFRDRGVFSPPGIEPVLIDRYELKAGLRIRFDNRDSSPQREQKISVTLRTDTDSHELHVAAYEDERYIKTLTDVLVQGGDVSPYYDLTCDATLDLETVEALRSDSYLRVTLEAINQDLYCVDLDVDWGKAREGKEVHFTVRRKGGCSV